MIKGYILYLAVSPSGIHAEEIKMYIEVNYSEVIHSFDCEKLKVANNWVSVKKLYDGHYLFSVAYLMRWENSKIYPTKQITWM